MAWVSWLSFQTLPTIIFSGKPNLYILGAFGVWIEKVVKLQIALAIADNL